VREEGAAGRLLTMAQETGGGLVRRDRGTEDGGARPACPKEEDKGGMGWLGWPKAEAQCWFGGGGPKEEEGKPAGRRQRPRRLGKKKEMGPISKRNSFRILN
jgi:hypothetical protein